MRIENDLKLDYSDVLIRPKRSTLRSRKDVELNRTFTFKYSNFTWNGFPIMASNMDTVGTFEMSNALKEFDIITVLHKHYSIDDWKKNKELFFKNSCSISIGSKDEDLDKLDNLINLIPDIQFLTIDVANGYGEYFANFVGRIRNKYPKLTIIAGNVVTGEMTEQLILSGADILKIGIGSGSCCTTRIKTGCGYPQLSSLIECVDAAHGLGGHIIADGGCTCPGDIVKAFGAGADFVMVGGLFAGHDESGGEEIIEYYKDGDVEWKDGGYIEKIKEKKYKIIYGMSSDTAQNKYHNGQKEYRASEGRTVKVPYRGPIKNTIREIIGGLRSAMTYVGATRLKELSKRTTFIRVNQQYNKIYED